MAGSPSGQVNTEELVKVLKTAGLVALSAAAVSFCDAMLKYLADVSLGEYQLLVLPFVTALLKGVKEYFTNNNKA